MKKFIITSILAALVALGTTVKAQDYPEEYLGLPGDNLNLYAVMKLFQESETLESFERNLNNENSRINNLDLNGDNLIDYITVSDYLDGDVHTIVLRVALDRNDFQDVAVFTVLRFQNGSVSIQLIGDEALYGKNYIIEPIYDETPNPGYTGRPESRTYVTVVRTTPYEVAAWPLIRFIFMPNYVMWRSSWYWGYYPDYWNPWHPYYWHYYYGYHYNWYSDYYSHYHHYDHPRYDRYNDFYYRDIRAHSPMVAVNINKNVYRNTYSHPEQRKDGEALYSRIHPDQNRTMESRRPETGTRQSNTGNRQEATRPSAGQRPVTGNRQPASAKASNGNARTSASQRPETGNRQEATRPSSGQSADASRKSNPSASGRSEYKPAQSRSDQNARSSRSTPSASDRSASRPEQSQRSQNARASKPSTSSQRSSASRSRQQSKSAPASREKAKDNSSDSRRK
jgi:hypothetical protein